MQWLEQCAWSGCRGNADARGEHGGINLPSVVPVSIARNARAGSVMKGRKRNKTMTCVLIFLLGVDLPWLTSWNPGSLYSVKISKKLGVPS